MRYHTLTVDDIMERNIIYYDQTADGACRILCHSLNIDNLPAIDKPCCYVLDADDNFSSQPISVQSRVQSQDRLFDEVVLNKFRQANHNVLFVYEGLDRSSDLVGIVHISDFNRDIIIQAIQDDLLSFERTLRQFLVLNNQTDEDIRTYFKNLPNPNKQRNKQLEKPYDRYAPFQQCYLHELLHFTNHLRYADVQYDPSIIQALNGNLRNGAMHGKNVIELNNPNIYSLSSFERLVADLQTLENAYYKLRISIAHNKNYLSTRHALNRTKLNLIANSGRDALSALLDFK